MCIVKGRTPATNQNMDETVPSWPYLLRAELLVLMVTMLVSLVLSYFFDAPLKEIANPMVPENPAKAPWYFLGLQEMVSYSAVIGGIGNVRGAVVGGFVIAFVEQFGAFYVSSNYRDVYVFALLIVILLVLPNGLLGSPVRDKV